VKTSQDIQRQHKKEMLQHLYALPPSLNVDNSKSDLNVRFADRTAEHIKNGLQEVQLKPSGHDHESAADKEARLRQAKEERKKVFSQLM
jgi:hypothetical protein